MLEEEVAIFIRQRIKSVWALEVLLHLREKSGPETAEALVRDLRSSPVIIEEVLASLFAGKLLAKQADGCHLFQPATPALAALVERLAEGYRDFPVAVIQVIYAQASEIEKFANAFRLRKD